MIDSRDGARQLAATMMGACAKTWRAEGATSARALDEAIAAARAGFTAMVVPNLHSTWDRVLRMFLGEPPSGIWAVVLAEISSLADAAVLMEMFAYRNDKLFANGAPIDDLTAPAFPGERGIADLLADHVTRLGNGDCWDGDLLGASCYDATPADTESFVARCHDAGIEFHYPRRLPGGRSDEPCAAASRAQRGGIGASRSARRRR